MTSLGGHVTCRSMDTDFLKADKIEKVATSSNIQLLSGSELRWSLGLDTSNNFVIRNEVADANSFIADNDTGFVTLLGGSGGGGGGGSNLSDLNDVESESVSHKALLYYDDLSNNFKFSSDINVNSLSVSSAIEANIIFSYDPIIAYGNVSRNFVENDCIVFDKNTITALDAFGEPKKIMMGNVSVNHFDANTIVASHIVSETFRVQKPTSSDIFYIDPSSLMFVTSSYALKIDASSVSFSDNIQIYGNANSQFIVDPIRQRPNSSSAINVEFDVNLTLSSYDTLLLYDTTTKEIQHSLSPKLYNVDMKHLDASNVNVSDTLGCGRIKYADNIAKVAFNKISASGSDTVHTLASFKVENVSADWNFGHIHLHYAVQQSDFHTPYGGGEAHIHISFQRGLQGYPNWHSFTNRHLNKINTDGDIESVAFKVSLTSPNIIDITYQNSINNVTSVAGVVELIVSNASITPI
jgi:hypothetical protein